MSSESSQVRSLLAALAQRIEQSPGVTLSGKNIAGFYMLLQMNSIFMTAPFVIISISSQVIQWKQMRCSHGKNICTFTPASCLNVFSADALSGLQGMTTDCAELRALLSALAERIDAEEGKLDSQDIGNAL